MTWPVLLADAPQPGGGGFASMLPALMMIFVAFYFLLIRPEQRKRKAQMALLNSLKKNDRIVTVGGIYGVVTNVQRDADEVTIKVDESNNTKIRITFGSVARVITGGTDGEKAGKS
ncbi:MAG: preprotein translocase subunit YajC [Planctomycetes bacterium RBG_16_64_10]|nr:MAG: preprotein translocase subunit YajC [Planctomycetes bacterium RBG_16_64_10]